MAVFVEDAAEMAPAADVQPGDEVAVGDGLGQRLEGVRAGHCIRAAQAGGTGPA